jgi:hypothetical protein
MRLLAEAGVPDGVANLVNGYGHTVGAAITAHPDVEKVAFTGSTEVGRAIVHASADSNLNKVTLELGGKSPVLIFDDAKLKKAIPSSAFGTFVHSGQACVCGSRILVQRGIYDQVVEGMAMVANAMKMGGPKEEGTMSGPLISQKQLKRVLGYLEQGKSDGAEIVTSGTDWTARATSSTRPSSPTSTPTPASCSKRKFSGRSSRSCRSTMKTKLSRLPITAPTGWPPRCGPRTLAALTDWPSGSRPEPWGSTALFRTTTPCRSGATSSPGGDTNRARLASRPTCRRRSSGRRCKGASRLCVRDGRLTAQRGRVTTITCRTSCVGLPLKCFRRERRRRRWAVGCCWPAC